MSEGNGPVNALAQALKATLAGMYPALTRVRLADYRVDLLGAPPTAPTCARRLRCCLPPRRHRSGASTINHQLCRARVCALQGATARPRR